MNAAPQAVLTGLGAGETDREQGAGSSFDGVLTASACCMGEPRVSIAHIAMSAGGR
jgi:hypothetical protein